MELIDTVQIGTNVPLTELIQTGLIENFTIHLIINSTIGGTNFQTSIDHC